MRNFQDIAFIWTQTYTDIFKSALEYEDITKIEIRRYYFYKDVNQKRKITIPNVWFLSPSGIIWIIFRCILMNPMHYSLPQSPAVPIFDAPVSNSNNNSIQEIPLIPIVDTRLCVSVCVCVCVFTSIHCEGFICLDSWNLREEIRDVVLKMSLYSVESLHRYFRMKHLAFLTSHLILFTH